MTKKRQYSALLALSVNRPLVLILFFGMLRGNCTQSPQGKKRHLSNRLQASSQFFLSILLVVSSLVGYNAQDVRSIKHPHG